MNRRGFVTACGVASVSMVSGCLSDTDSDPAGSSGSPDLTISELRHPEPQGVSLETNNIDGDRVEVRVTIENTGMEGELMIAPVLLEEADASVWSLFAKEVYTIDRFFSDGERRTLTMEIELDESDRNTYENVGARFLPTEAEVEVKNDGGSGEIEVQILQDGGLGDGNVFNSKNVEIGGDTTQTVHMSLDISTDSLGLEEDTDQIGLSAEANPV